MISVVSAEEDACRLPDGQIVNSTIREGKERDWDARKFLASVATRGEGRRIHSSSGRPNLASQSAAS